MFGEILDVFGGSIGKNLTVTFCSGFSQACVTLAAGILWKEMPDKPDKSSLVFI